MFLSSLKIMIGVAFLAVGANALAQDLKPFQPFDLSTNKALTSHNQRFSNPDDFFENALSSSATDGFDFLENKDNGYHLSKNNSSVFGQELVVGMKFADWLSLRLNVIEDNDSQLFASFNRNSYLRPQSDLAGYQLGLSSILNISTNWRLGFDVGMGRVGGDLVGLYHDQLETTRLGFGIRNKRFGATFQSDFMSNSLNNELEQSTMDLQVDWHFTKEGTISFGARRSVNENNAPTSIDQLTGTVPYIKFKHNL